MMTTTTTKQGKGGGSEQFDKEIGLLLSNFQQLVCLLTNARDHQRLIVLQDCLGAVLKSADECLSQNKEMRIKNLRNN